MADLADYAGHWEDQETDTQPADYRWFFVERFPVNAAGTPEDWTAFWEQENTHSDIPNYWDHLLEPVADGSIDPLVSTVQTSEAHPDSVFLNVWDGAHRLGAAAIVGCDSVPMVLGIPMGMTREQIPALLRDLPALKAIGAEPPPPERKLTQRRRTP